MTVTGFIIFTGIIISQTAARHVHHEDFYSSINLTDLLFGKPKHQGRPEPRLCLTEACKRSARDIHESLDLTIDPCEDFYKYACGGWIRNHPVPSTENHWNQFDILDKKLDSQIHKLLQEPSREGEPEIVKTVKKVFRSCMNIERIEKRGLKPLVKLLEEFGGWPMATSKWDRWGFDWQKLTSEVAKKLAINSILLVYVDVDRKNTSRNVLIVDEPNLGLPRYMLIHSHPNYIEPYGTYIAKSADLVAKARGENIFPFGILSQSFNMMKFEMELAKIMRNEEEKRSAEDMYNLVTIGALQEWTDKRKLINPESRMKWKSFIQNLSGAMAEQITDETPIVVTDWEFLADLMDLIDVTPPRVIANYVLWRVVNTMSRDLNNEMTTLNFNFKSQLSTVQEDYPRWRDCVLAAGHLSFVVGYMYVQKHFSGEAKQKAVQMVEDIRFAFKKELSEVPWMDGETKKQAMEKADFMNHFIGYPNWYENITFLDNYYDGVKVGEEHFENKVRLRQFLSETLWESLNEETNREEWVASPAIANAFYNPQLNSIIFPAGVLQKPFFDKDQPEALNYGSIGAVVGHEITHGFDDMGRQSDKLGNIKQWWSKETEKTYMENALCFINQYRNYRVPELDELLNTKVTMNGVLTLDENIADNGGLRAALRAYKSHKERNRNGDLILPGLNFTPEQLFYIGFARVWCESHTTASLLGEVLGDSHSPHRLRVVGSLSNSEHFATTWRCKLGSNMNPEKKCKLW